MSQCGPPGDERMTCTFTGEELTIPFARPEDRFDSFDCPRPVWEHASASRCVWHADQSEKPPEKLSATVNCRGPAHGIPISLTSGCPRDQFSLMPIYTVRACEKRRFPE